ncbi:MAG: LL-diaminopimelate aminotransferase [Deltaproteobacteria bacterium]|jgi:LL-diaminopimelate aminotransferase|nr:LL-diaminopimelate aminotransferase [Deltaproteobacteria bacterium]
MAFQFSERLKALPPYLFQELDSLRDKVVAKGVDVIDLGVGDPDRPTPDYVIEALYKAAKDPANHKYPVYSGMDSFRKVVANWYKKRHNVDLVPDQVCSLIGSKEGISQIHLAFINPNDVVLCPEPCYPVYISGTGFAGAMNYFMPLLEKNSYLPDLDAIPQDTLKNAKLIWVNYPNNPTGASAPVGFYERLIKFAEKWDLIICSDAAYSEVTSLPRPHPSILECKGALERAVEFNSLSKPFNMTGWRIGWAAGNLTLIQGLGKIKSNVDSGIFQAVQLAAIAALEGDLAIIKEMGELYAERRKVLTKGLDAMGLEYLKTDYTFYVWAKVPKGASSKWFSSVLLEKSGVVCTPGVGFGPSGEGYVRFALVQEIPRLKEAADRISTIKVS